MPADPIPVDANAFLMTGCNALTVFASGEEMLVKWADKFEQTGGQPVYGDDVLAIIYLNNEIQTFLTPERLATINKYRTDV